MKIISASELKARLLAVLDEVERTGEVVVVTKRGREVARLVGPVASLTALPQDELLNTVAYPGDVLAPIGAESDWAALSGASLVAEPGTDGTARPAAKGSRRKK